MEAKIKDMWFIGVDLEDGTTLFHNIQTRVWSTFQRDATGWLTNGVAQAQLKENKERDNVPKSTRVIHLRTTIEEVIE